MRPFTLQISPWPKRDTDSMQEKRLQWISQSLAEFPFRGKHQTPSGATPLNQICKKNDSNILVQTTGTAKSSRGNQVLLQIQDQLTNQHQIVALATDQISVIADALFHHWFCHSGFSAKILINVPITQCQELHQELRRWINNWGLNENTPHCIPHPDIWLSASKH